MVDVDVDVNVGMQSVVLRKEDSFHHSIFGVG